MRKLTTILLAVMLVVALFVSCDNNVSNNIEETVSVNFEGGRARNLTATLETFNKDDLYWKYTAKKTDETGLKTGETSTEIAVKSSGAGLGSVSGFSQGKWKFTLFAYKDQDFKNLAYKGEIETSLKKDSDNKVLVTVSPVKTENVMGKLVIDTANIKITKNGSAIEDAAVKKVYKVVKVGSEDTTAFSTETSYDLKPGAYKVTVAFVDDTASATYTYASGSVVATVYSNLTTTVTGGLEELVTKAVFDSAINPDIMNTVATSSTMEYSNLSEGTVALSTSAETGSDTAKVTATVTAADAKKIIQDVVGSDDADTTGTKVSLALSVDTTAATSNSLELEIGMSATVTNSKGEATTTEVKSLDSYSVVTINLQKQLTSVVVKHDGNEMTALKSEIDSETSIGGYGAYYYNADSGVLTIKTKTFSPFTVTYDAPVYVAKIGSKNYTSLQEALDSVGEGETITLYGNVTSDKGFIFSKNVTATLDLNGYTLKVTNGTETDKHGALYITNGTLTVTNGTINAINVGGNGNQNVYDESTKIAYTLGSNGTITDSNGNAKSASELGSNLVLLDCSLSNNVPDEFASKNWEVVHNNCSNITDCYHEENTSDFSGGYGTKVEPYLIADKTQFQNITGKYDKYAYYKIKDGVTEIDCSDWTPVKLYGSFDGNGVKLSNIDSQLFKYIGKIPSSTEYTDLSNWDTRAVTIEDFEANFNLEGSLDIAAGMTYMINGNNTTTFKDVTVSGTIIGGSNSGVFFCYTSGNAYNMYPDCQDLLTSQKIVLKGCTVNAKLINPNGIIGVIGGYPTFGNKKVTIECDKDMTALHSNYKYDETNSGIVGYLAITSFWNNDSTVKISDSYLQSSGNSFECKPLYRAKPTKGDDNYTISWSGKGYSSNGETENGTYTAARMEVYIAAQLNETDDVGNVIAGGITIGLSHLSTIKKDNTSGNAADVLGVFNSVSLTQKQNEYSAKVDNSTLVCTTGGGSDGPNYTYGTIKLQVALFDSNDNMVAYVNEIIAQKDSAKENWSVVTGQ